MLCGNKITLKLKVRHPDAPVEPEKYGAHGWCTNVSSSKLLGQHTSGWNVFANESVLLLKNLKVCVALSSRISGVFVGGLVLCKFFKIKLPFSGVQDINNSGVL